MRGASHRISIVLALFVAVGGCQEPDPELIPDQVLQSELGLTVDDRVHTVRISTGPAERAQPPVLVVRPGDYVQFVSADRFVHEVAFMLDRIDGPAGAFLRRTGQVASAPLLELESRFVVSFVNAPEGRYPYALSGNREPGVGEIVVETPPR